MDPLVTLESFFRDRCLQFYNRREHWTAGAVPPSEESEGRWSFLAVAVCRHPESGELSHVVGVRHIARSRVEDAATPRAWRAPLCMYVMTPRAGMMVQSDTWIPPTWLAAHPETYRSHVALWGCKPGDVPRSEEELLSLFKFDRSFAKQAWLYPVDDANPFCVDAIGGQFSGERDWRREWLVATWPAVRGVLDRAIWCGLDHMYLQIRGALRRASRAFL